jgi:hypothetical protein
MRFARTRPHRARPDHDVAALRWRGASGLMMGVLYGREPWRRASALAREDGKCNLSVAGLVRALAARKGLFAGYLQILRARKRVRISLARLQSGSSSRRRSPGGGVTRQGWRRSLTVLSWYSCYSGVYADASHAGSSGARGPPSGWGVPGPLGAWTCDCLAANRSREDNNLSRARSGAASLGRRMVRR